MATLTRRLLWGMIAGAAGTATLNLVTYLDMAVRGRPASTLPADVARGLADQAGIDLAPSGDQPTAEARATALGALLGFVTGIGLGAGLGALHPIVRQLPSPVVGTLLAAAANVGSAGPATVMGITDPRQWGTEGWMADIVPHLTYGLVTAAVYDSLAG